MRKSGKEQENVNLKRGKRNRKCKTPPSLESNQLRRSLPWLPQLQIVQHVFTVLTSSRSPARRVTRSWRRRPVSVETWRDPNPVCFCGNPPSFPGHRCLPPACVWNELPRHVTTAPSLQLLCSRLETRHFSRSFPDFL